MSMRSTGHGRRRPTRSPATALLCALAVAACSRLPAVEPPTAPAPVGGQFALALLTADDQPVESAAWWACAVPVHGAPAATGVAPAVGLTATALRAGAIEGLVATDDSGVGALADLAAGYHDLELASADGLLHGRLVVEVTVRRTQLRGRIAADGDDLDGDGDRSEWALVADALPDSDGNDVSDTGVRDRWFIGLDGGTRWRHGQDNHTERSALSADGDELPEPVRYPDRDGDFTADDQDPDVDGDGTPNGDEGTLLACPGFSHAQLTVPGSRHEPLTCTACHRADRSPAYACSDCHTAAGRAPTGQPDNAPADHPRVGCQQCHVADRPWVEVPGPAGSQHADYALIGAHLDTDCFRCHVGGHVSGTSQVCADCHRAQVPPDHAAANCESCHTPVAWRPPLTSHEQFPLAGGHAGLACTACHTSGAYSGLATACASCHQAVAPAKHSAAGFASQPCDGCHRLSAWSDFRDPHPNWLLTGRHVGLPCNDCHARNPDGYTGNQQHCAFCHATPPSFPDHSNFTTDCEQCHGTDGWVPAFNDNIDHAVYPLVGAHLTAPCSSCHVDGTVLRPARTCSACHGSERPLRHTGYFDGECDQCHQPTTWAQQLTPYQHSATFVIDGAHAALACSACHATSYQASPLCIACHLADRPADHYGDDCTGCHTTDNWNPTGSMNHHSVDPSALPLTGGHANLLCSQCHLSAIGPLPRACESCHLADRPAGHALDGCASCHGTGSWLDPTQPAANGMHPLRGGHVAVGCSSCHGAYTSGTGFAAPRPSTTCSSCHPLPAGHIATGSLGCDGCHTINAWLPASGGHSGAVPTSPFNYSSWSGRWFSTSHRSANTCGSCHTRSQDLRFFSCTTRCHRDVADLDDRHNNGANTSTRQFHLYHFDPGAANSPPDEGGALWPTGHVGCVNRSCHPGGSSP